MDLECWLSIVKAAIRTAVKISSSWYRLPAEIGIPMKNLPKIPTEKENIFTISKTFW